MQDKDPKPPELLLNSEILQEEIFGDLTTPNNIEPVDYLIYMGSKIESPIPKNVVQTMQISHNPDYSVHPFRNFRQGKRLTAETKKRKNIILPKINNPKKAKHDLTENNNLSEKEKTQPNGIIPYANLMGKFSPMLKQTTTQSANNIPLLNNYTFNFYEYSEKLRSKIEQINSIQQSDISIDALKIEIKSLAEKSEVRWQCTKVLALICLLFTHLANKYPYCPVKEIQSHFDSEYKEAISPTPNKKEQNKIPQKLKAIINKFLDLIPDPDSINSDNYRQPPSLKL